MVAVVATIHGMAKEKENKPSADRHYPHKLVRLSLELFEELRKIANANNRPVAWEIRGALEEFVRKHKGKKN